MIVDRWKNFVFKSFVVSHVTLDLCFHNNSSGSYSTAPFHPSFFTWLVDRTGAFACSFVLVA